MKQADKLEDRKRETEMADEEDKGPLEMSDRTSNLGGDGQKRQSEGGSRWKDHRSAASEDGRLARTTTSHIIHPQRSENEVRITRKGRA